MRQGYGRALPEFNHAHPPGTKNSQANIVVHSRSQEVLRKVATKLKLQKTRKICSCKRQTQIGKTCVEAPNTASYTSDDRMRHRMTKVASELNHVSALDVHSGLSRQSVAPKTGDVRGQGGPHSHHSSDQSQQDDEHCAQLLEPCMPARRLHEDERWVYPANCHCCSCACDRLCTNPGIQSSAIACWAATDIGVMHRVPLCTKACQDRSNWACKPPAGGLHKDSLQVKHVFVEIGKQAGI